MQHTYSADFESPSNIALVKYWGKKPGVQLPANPSISFTLDKAVTDTSFKVFSKNSSEKYDLHFEFEGNPNPAFKEKLIKYFDKINAEFPFLTEYKLEISSSNTFPHSSGIASSASSMSALALCICDLHEQITGTSFENFHQKASEIARIGSGSASRSIYPGLVMWGEHQDYDGSSDFYAIPFNTANQVFMGYHDVILIVEKGQKKVSSSAGHSLLEKHPFAKQRYETANVNMHRIKTILEDGDIDGFIEIVESEALMLHALMMASTPSFILMKPNTLAIIEKIREFRSANKIPVCFTLDAGANVHVLFPDQYAIQVMEFVQKDLVVYCEEGTYFCNRIKLPDLVL
ncbi:MAG: diphosphomevalonate decarboxylase [Bacteroidia bacterium]|nr:diphosphomevalonate decarboxylase [Bacteroidia bacterium]